MTTPTLPRSRGRGPRVAMLVYNDAHNDTRVLKEAASLRSAGATVRIFAVARPRAGYGPGVEEIDEGLDIARLREFSLAGVAAPLRRGGPSPLPSSAQDAHEPQDHGPQDGAPDHASQADPTPDTSPDQHPVPPEEPARGPAPQRRLAAAGAVLGRVGADVAMRAYRTVSLSAYWLRAARAVLAWRPDVVHANDANTLAPALWVVDRCGARLVYDSHELWRHRNVRPDRPVAPRVEAAIETRGIERADAVVTVSPSIVEWLDEHYHLSAPPVLVRNIPVAGPPPDPARGRLRALAGLAPEARVIAYGGRLTTSRGLEETIAALAELPDDVHLVMLGYGEPDYLAALEEAARRAGVADRVHRVGPVAPHEVAESLADADLSVVHVRPTCLSYRFALPNKLFESIRAGLPVAAADLPDIRAVVEGLGVGEVFDGEDPGALAATISTILDDPGRYRAAARAAAPSLTWENEAEALLGAYRQALMGGRA
ncbi:MAG: glycosyltransferase [Actinomyces sp.]|uniref:glycosyltransferase n=1 Tax=Actinomyces sp. TaxID=29317 RepID=UPI0026DB85BC|nr:glycosyltransferase [Actinomyces sp.]MDO4242219.1 glycosyltransferase [Actinomyces sp.]